MSTNKITRSVNALCPTCGCSSFFYESVEMATCAMCGREITKDELIRENNENIKEHTNELAEGVKDKLVKDLRESLKKSFFRK